MLPPYHYSSSSSYSSSSVSPSDTSRHSIQYRAPDRHTNYEIDVPGAGSSGSSGSTVSSGSSTSGRPEYGSARIAALRKLASPDTDFSDIVRNAIWILETKVIPDSAYKKCAWRLQIGGLAIVRQAGDERVKIESGAGDVQFDNAQQARDELNACLKLNEPTVSHLSFGSGSGMSRNVRAVFNSPFSSAGSSSSSGSSVSGGSSASGQTGVCSPRVARLRKLAEPGDDFAAIAREAVSILESRVIPDHALKRCYHTLQCDYFTISRSRAGGAHIQIGGARGSVKFDSAQQARDELNAFLGTTPTTTSGTGPTSTVTSPPAQAPGYSSRVREVIAARNLFDPVDDFSATAQEVITVLEQMVPQAGTGRFHYVTPSKTLDVFRLEPDVSYMQIGRLGKYARFESLWEALDEFRAVVNKQLTTPGLEKGKEHKFRLPE